MSDPKPTARKVDYEPPTFGPIRTPEELKALERRWLEFAAESEARMLLELLKNV